MHHAWLYVSSEPGRDRQSVLLTCFLPFLTTQGMAATGDDVQSLTGTNAFDDDFGTEDTPTTLVRASELRDMIPAPRYNIKDAHSKFQTEWNVLKDMWHILVDCRRLGGESASAQLGSRFASFVHVSGARFCILLLQPHTMQIITFICDVRTERLYVVICWVSMFPFWFSHVFSLYVIE